MDLPSGRRTLVAAMLILAAVTGVIDAVSYLRMGHVFVANMTGNVVFLGFATQPGSGVSLPVSAVAIGGFLAGALAGGRLAVHLTGRPLTWLRTAFTSQAAILAMVALLGGLGVL
ncbi:YoaK family protein, partial [Nocardioides sp.]|uniref:YoaK family protein n=1 Tax=Nocardioides sp. TaxID=35761 RepID=UPI002B80D76E